MTVIEFHSAKAAGAPGASNKPTQHEQALCLLADIYEAFAQAGDPVEIRTRQLLDLLCANPEGQWASYGARGTGLTPRYLAMLLKDFGISSKNFRFQDGPQGKGFARAQFTGAWTRHCPGLLAANPVTDRTGGDRTDHRPEPYETDSATEQVRALQLSLQRRSR